ncbi:hydrogenase expression/formation protein HypE [Daejeonia sp. YH14]|uniref:hydrogenase expression/formation protein HypE n=1 Tax=Daejeonia sp. YH14 TaxID=3439042 RepID=UPI003F4942FC
MEENINLQHGSGGEKMTELLNKIIFHHLDNPILQERHDGAFLDISGKIAFSSDSFVVSPVFFKGGNIGELAVFGTVNDLSMCGAEPKYLSLSLILEEGFSISEFEKIIKSIKEASEKSGVQIVTGDTKVVERGKGDGIYINTSGIGVILPNSKIGIQHIRHNQSVLLNAPIASHGMAIMSQREGLQFDGEILSDTTNLNFTVKKLIATFGDKIHFLRDATRGGLASVLNEITSGSHLGIHLYEDKIQVKPQVKSACELLGLDPVYVANEGVFLCICDSDIRNHVLQILKEENPEASIIGHTTEEHAGKVIMESAFGGKHIVNPLIGEQLPRIC